MALYDFVCEACGPFEVHRRMALAADPAACPGCGRDGMRVFSPPGLVVTPAGMRGALDLAERSAHAPALTDRPRGRPMPHAHAHTHSPPWVAGC
jgi:putative FmdB family regulatory protein